MAPPSGQHWIYVYLQAVFWRNSAGILLQISWRTNHRSSEDASFCKSLMKSQTHTMMWRSGLSGPWNYLCVPLSTEGSSSWPLMSGVIALLQTSICLYFSAMSTPLILPQTCKEPLPCRCCLHTLIIVPLSSPSANKLHLLQPDLSDFDSLVQSTCGFLSAPQLWQHVFMHGWGAWPCCCVGGMAFWLQPICEDHF